MRAARFLSVGEIFIVVAWPPKNGKETVYNRSRIKTLGDSDVYWMRCTVESIKNRLTLTLRQTGFSRLEDAVQNNTKPLCRAKEFASLAGVTVRALHHYDRLGLLRPKQRSSAGYRLYSPQDFVRLEQIVVLKFLGVPLAQMRGLLESDGKMAAVLETQRHVLEAKRCQLDRAIRAIGNAQRAIASRKQPDWNSFQLIVKEITMQKNSDWKGKYFSAEAKERVAERQRALSPEVVADTNRQWELLYAEVEQSLGEDPAGPHGQTLAVRWRELVEIFTGGDPEILKGLQAMWEDRANWPESAATNAIRKPEVEAFLKKAIEASAPKEKVLA
jgi:MerR family transcriptional regulator, thiopeptide resistance regulator